MKRKFALLCLISTFVADWARGGLTVSLATGEGSPIIQTHSGAIAGTARKTTSVFKGIPYATPPVGPLRWHLPVAVYPWSKILDAKAFGPRCPQLVGASVQGNEDCLTLNIWTPTSRAPNELLPVFFFIHGGSHVRGSSSEQLSGTYLYDGEDLATNANAVVVTINYRLGALGFMGLHALSAQSGYGGSGNYGYLDAVQALHWVHDNVESFGGDPNRVTIFGQSAGG